MTDFTLGVEEEYQLVCARTAELRSRAGDVLEIDWSGDLHPENQQTMLEIGTRICASTQEVDCELRRLRLQVASAAAAEGLYPVAGGIHPFSHWEGQTGTASERYRRLAERYGRVIRTEQIFGMHTHVAVPKKMDRVQVMNVVREYTPHLLALSASSPIYEGEDTGYDSYRTILAQRLPHSGPPPRFPSEAGFREWVQLLWSAGAIQDQYALYWGVRPHPEYPTLEFRIMDVCPRVEDAVAIASLCRMLVAGAAEGHLSEAPVPWSESAADEVLSANEWQAARFGLEGVVVDPAIPSGKEPFRDAIEKLLDRLVPLAGMLGEGSGLDGVERILKRGNGAARIRRHFASCQDLEELVLWMSGETLLGVGLDRRREQREVSA